MVHDDCQCRVRAGGALALPATTPPASLDAVHAFFPDP
jgi:hypothetical protein